MTLESILIPGVVGIIAAVIIVVINKQTLGKFVEKLFSERASTESTAKSLSDLGYENNKLIIRSLREGSVLRKVVKATDEEQPRYYIPDECLHRAETLYTPSGASIMTIFIAMVLFIALTSILFVLIPDLIQMAKNAADKFKTL